MDHGSAPRIVGPPVELTLRKDQKRNGRTIERKLMSTIADAMPGELSGAADRRRRIIAIVGASSGNLVEWYDFYAYAFTSIYFASAFFPGGDATSQLLATAGIFAVGFFMRPLGGCCSAGSQIRMAAEPR
jgi:hypothetical protein